MCAQASFIFCSIDSRGELGQFVDKFVGQIIDFLLSFCVISLKAQSWHGKI